MNIFKKLFAKFKNNAKKDNKTWYNDKQTVYDPKTGTPNGEAYISPNSVDISIANYLSSK